MENGIIRTDLAAECIEKDAPGEGIVFSERTVSDITVSETEITDGAAAERIGKPVGRYITLDIGKIWIEELVEMINSEEELMKYLVEGSKTKLGDFPAGFYEDRHDFEFNKKSKN